jgi:bacteriorhodopsin
MLVSFLYMVILLPHIGAITADNLASGWFLIGVAVALWWVPLLWAHLKLKPTDRPLYLAMSFAPVVMFAIFFSTLFLLA